jgi:hypothetical protein
MSNLERYLAIYEIDREHALRRGRLPRPITLPSLAAFSAEP